jgi:hypothetical protein
LRDRSVDNLNEALYRLSIIRFIVAHTVNEAVCPGAAGGHAAYAGPESHDRRG